jgi:hypothetical protein
METRQFVTDTYVEMQRCLDTFYRKHQEFTVPQRYKHLTDTFLRIVRQAEGLYKRDAMAYFSERQKSDKRLTEIQTLALDQFDTCIREAPCVDRFRSGVTVIPASSFSAGTYLVGDSDIDFVILVDKLDRHKAVCLANALGRCHFNYTEVRNIDQESLLHWVFEKYIDGVEIEGKVRDHRGFQEMLKMHTFLDTQMPQKIRVIVTYLKYLYKTHNKKAYDLFKMFYYCYGGHFGQSAELLYPLQ